MVARRLYLEEGSMVSGKYRITKSIGSGSYGDVFLVEDSYSRTCAMKVLRLSHSDPVLRKEMKARFVQEYETAKLVGEYLVHSIDYNEIEGNPYFTMEYCPNGDIAHYVEKNGNIQRLPQLAYDVLAGLYELDSNGKIHRDLKPENVLVRANGHAALTDFGTVGNKDPKKQMTRTNIFNRPMQKFGTPLYMAPEMFDSKGGGVTYLQTIDVFSFGVMIYELLTHGRFPFATPEDYPQLNDDQFLNKYRTNIKNEHWDRQALHQLRNGHTWEKILERCLKPDYRERYQSVLDIMHDIEPMLGSRAPVIEQFTRSPHISRVIITQGRGFGRVYDLSRLLEGKGRMIRVGRGETNDIVLNDDSEQPYLSRSHFTIERSRDGYFWMIKDGQWHKEEREWIKSTNGTYLNVTNVTHEGQRLYTGDIITAGEFKLKVE